MLIFVKYRTLGGELVDYPDELRFVQNDLGRQSSMSFDAKEDRKHFIDILYSRGETMNLKLEFCEKKTE